MRIETERLILREFTIDDLDAFAVLMANPEVMRFSLSGPMKEKDQAKEYLQKKILDHYVQYGYGRYAVIYKADKRLIGFVGLIGQNIDGENKTELGYRLHPNYWGKGLATEAALAICQYAFDQLGINELISIIDPQNKRSLEVAKRVGMHYWKEATFHKIPVQVFSLKKERKPFVDKVTFRNLRKSHVPNKIAKSSFRFSFKLVEKDERSLVHSWLKQPHVAEWFYGQGLENSFRHLDEFLEGSSFAQYWLGFDHDHPFAFLITSHVNKPQDELAKWCLKDGKALTLDMLIGDVNYLGKGYAIQVIQEFLLSQFPDVDEVLIDPEASNLKAVHVYQKAGFEKIGEFIPSHSPNLHCMMRLDFKKMKQKLTKS